MGKYRKIIESLMAFIVAAIVYKDEKMAALIFLLLGLSSLSLELKYLKLDKEPDSIEKAKEMSLIAVIDLSITLLAAIAIVLEFIK